MTVQPLYGEGPHPVLWAGLWDAYEKVTISGMLNCLKCYVIFIICT